MSTNITITGTKEGLDSRLLFPSLMALPVDNVQLAGSGPGAWTSGSFTFDYNGDQYRMTYVGNLDLNTYADFHGIVATGTLGRLVNEDEQIYKTVATMSFQPDRNSDFSAGVLDTAAHLTPNALSIMNSAWGGTILDFLGKEGNDKLFGSDFVDFFDGGNGNDKFTGFGGNDQFLFGALGKANADHVVDFEIDKDTLLIDRSEGLFEGVSSTNLQKTFHDITNGSEQADDRILYNHKTGVLSYDADGSGHKAAVVFGYIDNHAELEWRDFDVA